MITLDNVIAGYTGPIVGPVSLRLWPGEVLGLGGANGAGKSTLLRALAGTARVFSGNIQRRSGIHITHHQQRPEHPPELPLLGRELLALLGAEANPPPLVEPLMDRPVAAMSGGQYQFLQAWACLNSGADVVLLDEPTNNLDGNAIDALSRILQALPGHRAVILVSHERAFLDANCHRHLDIQPWKE